MATDLLLCGFFAIRGRVGSKTGWVNNHRLLREQAVLLLKTEHLHDRGGGCVGIMLNELQVVVFSIDEQEYGIDIEKVQEIIRLPAVTRLPGTADYVLGITNLRGNVIPIVDLKKISLGLNAIPTEESRVIVVEMGEKRMGLVVDEVAEVIPVPQEIIVSKESIGTSIKAEYLLGVARFDTRLLYVLNVDKLIA